MTNTPEKNHDEPAPGEAANEDSLGSNVAASSPPEHGVHDRFDLSDIKEILSPTTQPVTSGRMPLFRR